MNLPGAGYPHLSGPNGGAGPERTSARKRDSILVVMIVLSPVGLAALVMAIGLGAEAAWQVLRGTSVQLPAPETIKLCGLASYAVGSWIAASLAWLWSRHRNMQREVLVFRKLTSETILVAAAGSVIVMIGVPIMTRYLAQLTSGRSQDVRIDVNDPGSVAVIIFLFVITTPICEEILYRGLLVAWLRRCHWSGLSILSFGSLLFAANHLLPLGFVWSVAMLLLGVMTNMLRLRYESLSPAWLAHALFNAQLTLPYPLAAWLTVLPQSHA